jgi:hypothetical protein
MCQIVRRGQKKYQKVTYITDIERVIDFKKGDFTKA